MAEIINMPRLSDTMEEGVVAKWLKKVGDKVEEGDILAEIETDKATMEFESFHEGTLLYIGVEEGNGVPVDTLLAIVGDEGEDYSGLLNASGSQEKTEETTPEAPVQNEASVAASTVEIPEGVEVVKMPRLSDTMEEGTVATWLKKEGEEVEEGDILAEIETDKATMEFESFYSGTLLHIGIEEGGTAPVDEVLAIIGPKGTDVQSVLKAFQANGGQIASELKESDAVTPEASTETIKKETSGAVDSGGRIFASPLAKKIASEKGIELSLITGTGEEWKDH